MSRRIDTIFNWARREAWKYVRGEVLRVLPKGWTPCFAVGGGLCLYDADGTTVFGTYCARERRLPRGVLRACTIAAAFTDTFGAANERLIGRV